MANRKTAANVTVATATAASVRATAGKYTAAPKAVPVQGNAYMLTVHGKATAASGGAGKGGKVTVMGLVAVAAAAVAASNRPLTGGNIVAAMLALPGVRAAYASTKAAQAHKGQPGYAAGVPCRAWCSGYVAGAARAAAGLLATA